MGYYQEDMKRVFGKIPETQSACVMIIITTV